MTREYKLPIERLFRRHDALVGQVKLTDAERISSLERIAIAERLEALVEALENTNNRITALTICVMNRIKK